MKNFIKSGILVVMVAFSFVVFAADPLPPTTGANTAPPPRTGANTTNTTLQKLDNPIKATNVQELLFTIVDLAIFLGAIIAVFVFLWIGFQLIMARGDPKAVTDAKNWFLAAVIGTAVLMGSKIIVEVIKTTLVNSGVVDEKVFTLPK